jgi:hypothetical protein
MCIRHYAPALGRVDVPLANHSLQHPPAHITITADNDKGQQHKASHKSTQKDNSIKHPTDQAQIKSTTTPAGPPEEALVCGPHLAVDARLAPRVHVGRQRRQNLQQQLPELARAVVHHPAGTAATGFNTKRNLASHSTVRKA